MHAALHSRISRRRGCAWLAAALGLAALPPLRAQGAAPLDGRRFDTTAGLVGKAAHVPSDILSFEGGLFHSSDCDQYEYGKGRYTARSEGDAVHFESETTSPTYGRNTWKGVVRGNTIEGEFVFYRKPTWWRPNPEPLVHWFKGKELARP
jgi:hypothetical protein